MLRVSTLTVFSPGFCGFCVPKTRSVTDFFPTHIRFLNGEQPVRESEDLILFNHYFSHKQHQSFSKSLQTKDTKGSPALFMALFGSDSHAMNSRAKGRALCFWADKYIVR